MAIDWIKSEDGIWIREWTETKQEEVTISKLENRKSVLSNHIKSLQSQIDDLQLELDDINESLSYINSIKD